MAGEEYPVLHLRPGREFAILRGHPWIFSGAFRELPPAIPAGSVVDVMAANGEWVARGQLSPRNSLAFRVLTLDLEEEIDEAFYVRRIERALALRRLLPVGLDAYRVVNAEADFLPGLIVDRFAGVLVVQLHTAGAEAHRRLIVAALERVLAPSGILMRDDVKVREREGLTVEGPTVAAGEVPETVEINEHSVRFLVDPYHGQKTGFFLDQREKRHFIGGLAPHFTSLLNCFSYSGGFALAALARKPALQTVNVDASQAALDLARRNYILNGHDPAAHEFVELDVNRFLHEAAAAGRKFGIVVVDPPAFAKNLSMKERALRGYESLNFAAARVVAPDGLLLACSCSGAVSVEEFEAAVLQGFLRADRAAQLIASFGPSLDHPSLPGFPEDRYLKALLFRMA
ncbi:MAG TPA: class I SAM-dependent rRNA methyltransferase [Ktedonobacterales bacterium]|nr:class I SAM-dependent rRNA methyltransferase [Ktedonobacterales bacterium]